MLVTLNKKFGIHEAGSKLEANGLLHKHLLAGGFIKPKKKTKKK